MILLSNSLQHREPISPDAGTLLYRGLSWAMLGLLIGTSWSRCPDVTVPYSGLQNMAAEWLIDVVEALILMGLCLPLYALAFFAGGVSVTILFQAGAVLLAALLMTRAIQRVIPGDGEIALCVAQVALIVLSALPYLLILLPRIPQTVMANCEVISPFYVLGSCLLGQPPLVLFLVYYAVGFLSLSFWAIRHPSAMDPC